MSGIISPTVSPTQQSSSKRSSPNAISITGNIKDAIKSIVPGTVISPLTQKSSFGYNVWIKGDNELIYVYTNLFMESKLKVGNKVNQGDVVGYIGNSMGSNASVIYRNKSPYGNSSIIIYKQTKDRLQEIVPRKVEF
jgi:murein DD-endopeptidase MepM/ murein hydrolase activator NlpD